MPIHIPGVPISLPPFNRKSNLCSETSVEVPLTLSPWEHTANKAPTSLSGKLGGREGLPAFGAKIPSHSGNPSCIGKRSSLSSGAAQHARGGANPRRGRAAAPPRSLSGVADPGGSWPRRRRPIPNPCVNVGPFPWPPEMENPSCQRNVPERSGHQGALPLPLLARFGYVVARGRLGGGVALSTRWALLLKQSGRGLRPWPWGEADRRSVTRTAALVPHAPLDSARVKWSCAAAGVAEGPTHPTHRP